MKLITLGQKTIAEEKQDTPPKVYVEKSPAEQRLLDQLRHRLVSGNYHDSVEVKTAIVGEMIYLFYTELQKRRYR